MKKLSYLTLIAISFTKLNAQTTFSTTTLRSDTISSISPATPGGVFINDSLRAGMHVTMEQNLEVQGNLSLNGRFSLGNGLAMKSYPANTNHPVVFRFGTTTLITPGPGINFPLDPEDMPSCATPFLGVMPQFSFGGALKVSNGLSGSAVLAHDGANGILDVQGMSSPTIPGSLLINYYCHRNVAICTGNSINPNENKVFIGNFLNAAKHVEIGNPTYPNADATNTALDIITNAGKGIKFTTVNNTLPLISIANTNFPTSSPFTVYGDGRTFIGGVFAITTPYMLTVNGRIGAREIKVSIQNPWPDYVFNKSYTLNSLESVESYVKKHKHLPNIPSANELNKEELGLDLAQMQGLQMEKIEEIYLHLIELNKQVKELKKENQELKQLLKK